jgi:Asp/Glu/hydantoin racemase
MPTSKAAPAKSRRTSSLSGSAEIEAMVARTAPAILELLQDGSPRARSAIITALADHHPKEDVVRTLMRLAVTGQLVERNGKYNLGPAPETGERAD